MSDRPNILWILSDQHNPHIAGYAGDRKARTGNLDALAARSTRFDGAYCQSPLCVPSRISMLTGMYAYRCSAWNNGSFLRPDHRTFADHLSDHGYTTAIIGKMHLKGPRWMGGFQHRPYGDLIVSRFCFHQPDPVETWDGRWCSHSEGRFPYAGETEIPESLLADTVVTRESLAFLQQHSEKNPDKPWLLCAGYSRPHFPLTAPGRYIRRALAEPPPLPPKPAGYPESLHPHDRYIVEDFRLTHFSDEEQQHALACYYACVDYLDDCIGDLLDGLERAGLLENTYVLYTSDHGDMTGEHGLWWKRTYYDASAAVPLMISGSGIPKGRVVKSPVELVDLFPTFCDTAEIPQADGLDGETLLPYLKGKPLIGRRKIARSELLAPKIDTNFRMARDERWKYVDFPTAPPILFDLETDPNETTNLSANPPAEAPLDELEAAANQGLSWDDIARIRADDHRKNPPPKLDGRWGPAQYQLTNGRIVNADAFLYPGFSEA